MSNTFDSIILNGNSLRPAPFVSTNYEYNKYGEYIIGGFLVVTLSGTLVDENLPEKISELYGLQRNNNCINLIIGCSGNDDFLNGNGKIKSIDIAPSDQPYTATYTIQISIETDSNGKPIVEASQDFLNKNCLTNVSFLNAYSENITIQGEASNIGSVDSTLGVSKSYIKVSGKISATCYGSSICGVPSYNGIDNTISIIKQRAAILLSLNPCNSNHPLSQYAGWQKWLDTKSLDVNIGTGSVTWNFDMYISRGGCSPYAWVDITTEDKKDQKKGTSTRTISGTIKGLSSSTKDLLDNKSCVNERIANARRAYEALSNFLITGNWPSENIQLNGIIGQCEVINNPCGTSSSQIYCLQRISSNISTSSVDGQITFTVEFGDISACKPNSNGSSIDVSVTESLPVYRHVEIPIPYSNGSIVQILGITPYTAIINIKGSLQSCDTISYDNMVKCVLAKWKEESSKYNGWIRTSYKETKGNYVFGINAEYTRCDYNAS